MGRKVHLEQGTILTTKVNASSDVVYELTVLQFDTTTRKIKCKITEKRSSGNREEVFEGKFRRKPVQPTSPAVDETKIVAIMREVDFGNVTIRLIVTASEFHPLKDRIRVSPANLSEVFDNVEKPFGVDKVVVAPAPEDPDAEGFQRQSVTVSAPITTSTTTTPQPGAIHPGTVIVKDAAGPFAYDSPLTATTGKLKLFSTNNDTGDVKYDAMWNVTNLPSSTYTVEALRS